MHVLHRSPNSCVIIIRHSLPPLFHPHHPKLPPPPSPPPCHCSQSLILNFVYMIWNSMIEVGEEKAAAAEVVDAEAVVVDVSPKA